MISQYKKWEAFKFKGKKFLSLLSKDGNTHIYDENFNNYGAWFCVDSFKKYYAKDGEKLNLDKVVVGNE